MADHWPILHFIELHHQSVFFFFSFASQLSHSDLFLWNIHFRQFFSYFFLFLIRMRLHGWERKQERSAFANCIWVAKKKPCLNASVDRIFKTLLTVRGGKKKSATTRSIDLIYSLFFVKFWAAYCTVEVQSFNAITICSSEVVFTGSNHSQITFIGPRGSLGHDVRVRSSALSSR